MDPGYRLICPQCVNTVDVSRKDVKAEISTEIGYDFAGNTVYEHLLTLQCPRCLALVTLDDSKDNNNKLIYEPLEYFIEEQRLYRVPATKGENKS